MSSVQLKIVRKGIFMAYIEIRYDRRAFDSMIEKVKLSIGYSAEEKNYLFKMLEQMKHQDWLLYMVEIYHAEQFDFPIPNFEKLKGYLRTEVYRELLEQLVAKYADYEDIGYDEVRKWFDGMTINISILREIDRRLKEVGVRIRY